MSVFVKFSHFHNLFKFLLEIEQEMRYFISNYTKNIRFDAEWYCRKDPEENRYYRIFFNLCKQYNIRWSDATPHERYFIENLAQQEYERNKGKTSENKTTNSDIKDKYAYWYSTRELEENRRNQIFFEMCRKYDVNLGTATPQEKYFVEETTRIKADQI